MGEIAEAALWAEQNGIDPNDMGPEDWIDFYDESAPPSAQFIHGEAGMFLHYLDDQSEEQDPALRANTLIVLFPDLDPERAADLVRGLEALAALPEPDDEVER